MYSSFGLNKGEFKFPILRSGAISYFAYDASTPNLLPSMFLVDGVSFGGGSGSPVFSKNYFITDSSKIINVKKFIGIITGHYPLWNEISIKPIYAIDNVAHHDSIDIKDLITNYNFRYEQNSDLAIVISSDILYLYIINNYLKLFKNHITEKAQADSLLKEDDL